MASTPKFGLGNLWILNILKFKSGQQINSAAGEGVESHPAYPREKGFSPR